MQKLLDATESVFSKAMRWMLDPVARGIALFLGTFAMLNLAGNLRHAGFDANLWWIDLRTWPPVLANGFLSITALLLIWFAFNPKCAGLRRWLTLSCVFVLSIMALINAGQFLVLLFRGVIHSRVPLPLSWMLVLGLGLIMATMFRPNWLQVAFAGRGKVVLVAVGCAVLFPLGTMFCFGKTDYRRSADVAVVLGSRAYADGRPSDALADRVRTACDLYRQGWVKKLIFSGGPGDGSVHETESMTRMAISLGVKPADIIVDRDGLNTQATVKNTERMFAELHAARILVVSHFYHLPRVKLGYQRDGIEVFTVPAKESYVLRQIPFNMAREVVALWVYYLRPLAS